MKFVVHWRYLVSSLYDCGNKGGSENTVKKICGIHPHVRINLKAVSQINTHTMAEPGAAH